MQTGSLSPGPGSSDAPAESVVLEDAASLALEVRSGGLGYPVILNMYKNGMILKQGVGKLLSIDERDLRARSIIDLVMALKGVAGVARLRIRQNGAADSSVLNFSRPIKIYASSQKSSQDSAEVDERKRQPIIAHASTVKTTTHGAIPSARTYPAKAIMQWDYTASRDDELSAAAGETIIIAAEYKNPGWVWASRLGPNGQTSGDCRLCPANYFLLVNPAIANDTAQQNHFLPAAQSTWSSNISQQAGHTEMRLGAGAVGDNLMLSGTRATQEISVRAPHVPLARDFKTDNVAAGDFALQGHKALVGRDILRAGHEPPSPSSANGDIDGFGAVPREDISSLVDIYDPILDGMFEDEAGRISVQC